jgi:hypothetical protein
MFPKERNQEPSQESFDPLLQFPDSERDKNCSVVTLGDDAKAPRYVMTIPRRGYRFLADVEVRPAMSAESESPRGWWQALQGRLARFLSRQKLA